jgi:hypothetical protein
MNRTVRAVVWAVGMAVIWGAGSGAWAQKKTGVEPMIKTQWGQGDPFNSMLPAGNDGKRPITGCGVISAAQIMKYHNHPKRGNGQSEPYPIKTGTQASVIFDVDYDWDNMLNTYTSNATEQQRNAVATLIYHVGVGWKRDFAGASYSHKILPIVLTKYFGYDKSVELLYREYYDDAAWEAIIREQIDLGLPVDYRGYNSTKTVDHSWVVDGYDNTGKFHMNWGWSGKADGYYSLNALNPRDYDFNYNNHITINIKPDKGGAERYAMALDSFAIVKTAIAPNEQFIVNAGVNKQSPFPFDGQTGAALVDSKGNIAAVVGFVKLGSKYSINCAVPETVKAGQYGLRVVTRPTGGEWSVVTLYNRTKRVPNVFNITVTEERGAKGGGYGLALTDFTASKTAVSQNEPFTITSRLKNNGMENFPSGQVGAALVDNSGNIVSVIGTRDEWVLDVGVGRKTPMATNCTVPNTVPAGQYKLRIVVKAKGKDEWRVATGSADDKVPAALDFEVK